METQDIRPSIRMLFPPPKDVKKMFDVYPELKIIRCFNDLDATQMAFVSYYSDFNSPARVLKIMDKRGDEYIRERICHAMNINIVKYKYFIDKSNQKVEHAIFYFKTVLQDWDEIQNMLDLREVFQAPMKKAKEYAGKGTPTAMFNYKMMMEEVRKELKANNVGMINNRLFTYLERVGKNLIKDGELLLYEEDTKAQTELRAPGSLIAARAEKKLLGQSEADSAGEQPIDDDLGDAFS